MTEMPEEGDEKPFKCGEHGCGQTFTNEDHLNVHKLKHQMSLTLTPGTGNKFLFADQTPTPTKFLRYGEEIGLFNELSVNQVTKNPFDDAFKQATDSIGSSKHGKSFLPAPNEGLAAATHDQDTLNTPTPNIPPPVRQPDTPDTPIKKRYRFLDPPVTEPEFIPLPGPTPVTNEERAFLNNGSVKVAAKRERVESNLSSTTASSLDNSVGPASQESQSSVLEIDGSSVPDISSVATVSEIGDSGHDFTMDSSQSTESMMSPLNNSGTEMVDIVNRQSLSSSKGSKLEKIASTLGAKRPDTLAGLNSTITQLQNSVTLGTSVDIKPTLSQQVPILPSPVLSVSGNTGSSAPLQYMLQVMVQTPDGKMVPVHIPAVPQSNANSNVTTKGGIVSSSKTITPTSTTGTTNVSLLTKRKLKEAIQQNSPSGNKVFVSSANSTSRTASVSSQFSPSYSNPPTPRSTTSDVEYQAADSSVNMPSATSPRDDDDPDEKRRKFLERNRAAAARCRDKKKKWVNTLESKAEELQNTNTRLQNEVTQLRAEMAQLKALLLAHKDCPITIQQRNAGQLSLQRVPDVDSSDVQMVPVAIPVASLSQQQHTSANKSVINKPIMAQQFTKQQAIGTQFITIQGGTPIAVKQETGSAGRKITVPIAAAGQANISNSLGQGQIVAVDLSKVRRTNVLNTSQS